MEPFAASLQEELMAACQDEAALAIAAGNPPFGALMTDLAGRVLIRSHNTQVTDCDPTAHAEINLLRAAAALLGRLDFPRVTVVASAEPCSMCMSALVKVRIAAVYYGASHESHMDPDLSAAAIVAASRCPPLVVPGVLADACAAQIAAARLGAGPPVD
ncbi:MAG: nucleoside deaminase [Chloroflexota bacterium]